MSSLRIKVVRCPRFLRLGTELCAFAADCLTEAPHPMPALWTPLPDLAQLNALHAGTLGEVVGMEFTDVGPDFLQLSMPVDARTKQPAGLLHGGASAALAETAGSVASNLLIDRETRAALGTELNCSHLRGVRSGSVHARCTAIRVGHTLHVWRIDISDDDGRLVCTARLSVMIVTR